MTPPSHLWATLVSELFHHSIIPCGSFVADEAGVVLFNTRLRMTIATVIHLHAVPWVTLISRDISTPYVDTIAGQEVFLVLWHSIASSVITMADLALQIPHLHVCDVGEVDAIGLSGIYPPGDFLFIGHIFCQKDFLIRALRHRGIRILMTLHAILQFGDTGEGAIFAKAVAEETLLKVRIPLDAIHLLWVHVHGVTEIEGLWVLGIEGHGKQNPAHK